MNLFHNNLNFIEQRLNGLQTKKYWTDVAVTADVRRGLQRNQLVGIFTSTPNPRRRCLFLHAAFHLL